MSKSISIFNKSQLILSKCEFKESTDSARKLTEILEGDALDVQSFFEIADLVQLIVNNSSNSKYNLLIELVDTITEELLELEKLNSNNEDEIGFPHITIARINLALAEKLEYIGLYAKSYNVLSKAKDPTVVPYDFVSETGQTEINMLNNIKLDELLIAIMADFPVQIKTFFLRRAYISFKLSTILGNVGNEASAVFKQYRIFASKTALSLFDIKFYISFLELFNTNNINYSSEKDEVVKILKGAYTREKDSNNRFLIASSLGKTLKEKTWLESALSEKNIYYWEEYYKISILNECFEIEFDKQKTLNILWEFLNTANNKCENRMIFDLCKQKNSKMYTDLIEEFIKRNEYQFLMLISYNWNAFKPENINFQQIKDKNICILLPNLKNFKGVIFFIKFKDNYRIIPLQSDVTLNQLFEYKNIIEKNWQIVTGQEIDFDSSILENRRQIEASVEYLKLLEDFLRIKELKNHFEDIPKEIIFEYLETTWLNLPVVPLLSANLNHSFYITEGYENKKPDKKIQKALIWFNDSGLPYATYELDAIKVLLDEKSIQVDIFEKEKLTKETFLEKYQDASYDLVWIITHGEFDYNNPPYSYLYLSETSKISLWDLQNCTLKRNNKRNVILNACYSGCADVRHNSMGFIGIAPSLITAEQDILGHLWFVHDLASATLGIFTLKYLLEGFELTKATQLASRNMFSSNYEIANKIIEINPSFEISERVMNNSSIELSQPFYSMSPIIFK